MPEYKFRLRGDEDEQNEWLEWMTISERTSYLEKHPEVEQLVHGFPSDACTVGLGRTKPAQGFRDLLKQIDKNTGHPSRMKLR